MRGPGRGRFLYRILIAFLMVGMAPIVALSVSFWAASRGVLQRSLAEAAEAALALVRANGTAFEEEMAVTAETLAQDPAVRSYLSAAPEEQTPALASDLTRRVYAASRAGLVDVYVIPTQGETVGTGIPPREYQSASYRDWGIRGAAARAGGAVILFAQPHQEGAERVPLAVAGKVRARGEELGLVVLDIGRDRLATALNAEGTAFTELALIDPSGCVAFDLNRPYREGSFVPRASRAEGQAKNPIVTRLDRSRSTLVASAEAFDGFTIQGTRPIDPLDTQSRRIASMAALAGAFSAVAALILAILLSRSISRPVHSLAQTMGMVEAGDLSARSGLSSDDEIGILAASFDRMIAQVERLLAETIEQHRLLRAAEAKALKARIDPHFLYNTLNSVRSIARLRGVNEIVVIATSLGQLLRAGFATEGEFCTLDESLDLVRSYLDIEAVRYPGRFSFAVSADSKDRALVMPRLALQPLVENAVNHGLEPKVGKGSLRIATRRNGEDLLILVEDDGVGMSAERLQELRRALEAEDTQAVPAEGSARADADSAGIALVNIHRRLRLYYGAPYGLSIDSEPGNGTRAELRLPLRYEGGTPC